MYCNKCGKQITDNSVYCNYCGQKIEILDNKESDKSINEEPIVEELKQDNDSKTIQEVWTSEPLKRQTIIYQPQKKRPFSYIALFSFVAFFILLLIPFFINPSVGSFFRALGITGLCFLIVSFIFIFINKGIRKKWFIWLTVTALVISIISLILMANDFRKNTTNIAEENNSKQETSLTSSVETAQKGSKENPWPTKEAIQVGDVGWQILEVKDLGNTLKDPSGFGLFGDKKTTGRFIFVRFGVKNVGSEMKTLTGVNLVDNQDREYLSDSEAFMYVENQEELFLLDNINPGIAKPYSTIYEVPSDAKGLMLEVTSLEFAGTVAYIDLGLY